MKKTFLRMVSLLLAVLLVVPVAVYTASADTTTLATYRKGYNNISSSYAGSQYYANFQKIPLTGDGRTDVLAVAMSQLGYMESNSSGDYSGNNGGSGNYTEYCYNMGPISNSYSYWWCATFCAWALLQSRCTDQSTMGAWCRNHQGDYNYIWREVSCAYWSTQLKGAGYFYYSNYRGGSYTPRPGDLIFFYSSDYVSHIGLVNYVKDGYVYTIEGNTGGDQGVVSNGGRVCAKSYSLGSSYIYGYGALPYKTVNNEYTGIDYTGGTRTPGLYANPDKNKYMYSDEACTSSIGIINRYTMIEVTRVCSNGMLQATAVLSDGTTKSGYINPNAGRVIQMTKSVPAEDPAKIALQELVANTLTLQAPNYSHNKVLDIRAAYAHAVEVLRKDSATTEEYTAAYNALLNAHAQASVAVSKGKSYTTTENTRSDAYADDGKKLTDGVKGAVDGGTDGHSSWQGTDVTITVDLGSNTSTNLYKVYMTGGEWGIDYPDEGITVDVLYSTNGADFHSVGSTDNAFCTSASSAASGTWATYEYIVKSDSKTARYVRFVISDVNKDHIWLDEVEVYGGEEKLDDKIYITALNDYVYSGNCMVYTPAFGTITADKANHRYTHNVVAKWDPSKEAYVVKSSTYGGGYSVADVTLASDEIMIAAHGWEGSGIEYAVAGSGFNEEKLRKCKEGDLITLNGVTVSLGYYDPLAYISVEYLSAECEHNYVSVTTAPTCTEKGYTTYTCSACGDTYVDNYVDACHTEGEWVTLPDGSQEKRCSACGTLLESKAAPEITVLEGDVNKDGKVNMFDYIIVKSIYMGLSTPDEETFGLADVNNDGKVNMFDYIIIKSDCFA